MLVASDWLRAKPKQIVITGKPDADDTQALLQAVNRPFVPNKIVLLADGGAGQAFFAKHSAFIKDIAPLDDQATATICENFTCQRPTSNPAELSQKLTEKP